MSAGELLPLPFQCPDLVMPISGRIRSSQSQGSTTILGGQNDSFDFTTLTELEKKFLLGLKLLINENGEINDLGKYQTDQWIVWMAYQHHHFILHLWKPSTGELKQISFKDVQLLPEFDENGEIKYLRVTYQNGFILIMNDDYDFMKELCQLLESAALGGSGGVAGGGEISKAIGQKPFIQPEYIKTESKEDLLRDASITSRDSTDSLSSLSSSAEDLEKQRKRRAIGSVSMRRLSLTGRTVVKKSSHGGEGSPTSPREQETSTTNTNIDDDFPPPPVAQPELTTKKSVMSSVFGSISEDDDT